jgi:hypothetical protein
LSVRNLVKFNPLPRTFSKNCLSKNKTFLQNFFLHLYSNGRCPYSVYLDFLRKVRKLLGLSWANSPSPTGCVSPDVHWISFHATLANSGLPSRSKTLGPLLRHVADALVDKCFHQPLTKVCLQGPRPLGLYSGTFSLTID